MDAANRRVGLAVIRMDIHGRDLAFEVPVPIGPSRLVDLLPATGTIASQEAQANIDRAREEGKEIRCKAGCGACCRQLVAISSIEARFLSELVAAMPAERQAVIRERFREGIRKLEDAEIDLVRRWIEVGAPAATPNALPSAGHISDRDRQHWAFQPPRRPAVPTVARCRDAKERHRLPLLVPPPTRLPAIGENVT